MALKSFAKKVSSLLCLSLSSSLTTYAGNNTLSCAEGLSCVMGARLSTKEVLLNILKCYVTFYALYYVSSSIFYAVYKLSNFDGKIPFDFKTWIDLSKCCIGYSPKEMVNLISMEVTYIISGIAYGFIASRWVWDYVLTLSILHVLISSAVMVDFPLVWSWWVCLGGGMIVQACIGEVISYIMRRKRSAKVSVSPDQEPASFLYRKL